MNGLRVWEAPHLVSLSSGGEAGFLKLIKVGEWVPIIGADPEGNDDPQGES